MATASLFRPAFAALRPLRVSPLARRAFATTSDIPQASTSTLTHNHIEKSARALGLTSDPASGDAIGIEKDDLPSNLVFEEGEVDITDDVVKMFEKDGVFGSGGSEIGEASGSSSGFPGETLYLPLSSLADRNPTLPSSQELAIPLPPIIFHQPLRRDILHRCVVYYLSLLRTGTASTKTRAEVAKSGRKLYRQKGTGRARAGSAGSGTRRGGGTIHGPHQRDFAQKLPRKIRQLGLHVALSSRLKSGLLRIVSDLGEGGWTSTRAARIALSDESTVGAKLAEVERADAAKGMIESEAEAPEADEEVSVDAEVKFGPTKDLSILFVHGPETPTTSLEIINRSVRNIPGVDVLGVEELAAYEVLKRKWTVLDVSAVEWLAERAGEPDLFEEFEEEEVEFDGAEEEASAGESTAPADLVADQGPAPREQVAA